MKMKILFICSGNAHRSPLAEALLKRLRPDLDVDSAGIGTALPISEDVRRYLAKEKAQQFLKEAPESLDNKELDDYDLIVAMDQRHKSAILTKCPECEDKIVVWDIEDPYFMQHSQAEKIYTQIKKKTIELALSL